MRRVCLIIATILALGCGSGNSNEIDPVTGCPTRGPCRISTAAGGTTAGGGSMSLTGTCANLTCLSTLLPLVTNCEPGGTCTQQVSATGYVECYGNGVKMQSGFDPLTYARFMTFKNGDSVCYSMVFSPTTTEFRDASGATLATWGGDNDTGATTMTCPGGTVTVVDASCGSGPSDLTTAANIAIRGGSCTQSGCGPCTQGTCTF